MTDLSNILNLNSITVDHLLVDEPNDEYLPNIDKEKIFCNRLLTECGFGPLPDYRSVLQTKEALDTYKMIKMKLHLTKLAMENYILETENIISLLNAKLITEEKNKMIRKFLDQVLEPANNPNNFIRFVDLFDYFRSWYRCNYCPDHMSSKEFRTLLKNYFDNYDIDELDDKLHGYQIKVEENPLDELIN